MTLTTLREYAESLYFPLNIRCRSPKTKYAYELALRAFGRFLGHEPALPDLTDDAVTRWMAALLTEGKAVYTVREMAGRIQAMWNFLAKRRIVPMFPTFAKPAPPDSLPQALTEDQLRALFASAKKERGKIEGVPADLWWTSFLAFIWNTAERKSAALSVRVEWVQFDRGVCTIPPDVRKGGRKWAVYHLWPETVTLMRACRDSLPGRELMWPLDFCEGSYYTRYDRILADAGLPVTRKTKTHALRCSHATWLKVMGGDPTRQLGHSDPQTTARSYLDPRHLPNEQPKLFVPW